jgi:hypothetical protein
MLAVSTDWRTTLLVHMMRRCICGEAGASATANPRSSVRLTRGSASSSRARCAKPCRHCPSENARSAQPRASRTSRRSWADKAVRAAPALTRRRVASRSRSRSRPRSCLCRCGHRFCLRLCLRLCLRGAGDALGLSPRILHFAGHGITLADGKAPVLTFERPDGTADLHADFLEVLRRLLARGLLAELECIFLNACDVCASLGVAIHTAFPHLTIIGFTTKVADKAAACFAKGFYEYVGNELLEHRRAKIVDAYDAAICAWEANGCVYGDPELAGIAVHGKYEMLMGGTGSERGDDDSACRSMDGAAGGEDVLRSGDK